MSSVRLWAYGCSDLGRYPPPVEARARRAGPRAARVRETDGALLRRERFLVLRSKVLDTRSHLVLVMEIPYRIGSSTDNSQLHIHYAETEMRARTVSTEHEMTALGSTFDG